MPTAPKKWRGTKVFAGWAAAGQLKNQVDVVNGLENAPDALRRLFTGENLGKQLVKIADPELFSEPPRT